MSALAHATATRGDRVAYADEAGAVRLFVVVDVAAGLFRLRYLDGRGHVTTDLRHPRWALVRHRVVA